MSGGAERLGFAMGRPAPVLAEGAAERPLAHGPAQGSLVMNKIRIIVLAIATLTGVAAATVALTTDASACPRGHVRCGPGCCPTR